MSDDLADESLIAAEGAIANVVGMTQMNPPVKDLCE
jgi:splicing factor 3B subunit 1